MYLIAQKKRCTANVSTSSASFFIRIFIFLFSYSPAISLLYNGTWIKACDMPWPLGRR